MEKRFFCDNENDTYKLGFLLGNLLSEGDVVCLSGQLGAGKTTFAKAVAEGMGFSAAEVTSPTFTIMNIYEGEKVLQHFDLYRLDNSEELEAIGFEESLGNKATSLVEWADLFPEMLPASRLDIEINIADNGREFIFAPHGERYEYICQEVGNAYTRD